MFGFAASEAFHHAIQSPSIDLKYFGSAAHVSVATLDHVRDVLMLDLFQGNEISGKHCGGLLSSDQQEISEVRSSEHAGSIESNGPLHHIFQFANIARPCVTGKQ